MQARARRVTRLRAGNEQFLPRPARRDELWWIGCAYAWFVPKRSVPTPLMGGIARFRGWSPRPGGYGADRPPGSARRSAGQGPVRRPWRMRGRPLRTRWRTRCTGSTSSGTPRPHTSGEGVRGWGRGAPSARCASGGQRGPGSPGDCAAGLPGVAVAISSPANGTKTSQSSIQAAFPGGRGSGSAPKPGRLAGH